MKQINDLLDAKLIEEHKLKEKRNYLGASMLGDECIRKVQLQYMKHDANFSAQNLRTFDIGNCLESLIFKWMIFAGFDLRVRNENGKQFGFSIANGKIAGHCDGIIFGFPPELKSNKFDMLSSSISFASVEQSAIHTGEIIGSMPQALWECKTMNNKNWNDTAKRGVLVSKPTYYVQVQLYMAYLNLDENPCLFTALNKDTSEVYHEFIPFDAETAQKYSDRAVQIIKATESNELLPRLSNDSSHFKCKMCGFRNVCWGDAQ
ncbi:hypothetical protein FACS1894122_13760 [Alphaproteobacteria bacterium]|nr:hypothetical protein FACS1894122_13760 [Alphaproteobacteria bacterium]